jgi:hypothetical protein
MILQTVLMVCGSCCLLMIIASCLLSLLAWLLRNIRPRWRGNKVQVSDQAGDVIEGEYKEIDTNMGEGS